jgi:hypothetical protein
MADRFCVIRGSLGFASGYIRPVDQYVIMPGHRERERMYLAIQRRRSKSDLSETRFIASCPGLALVPSGWETGKGFQIACLLVSVTTTSASGPKAVGEDSLC